MKHCGVVTVPSGMRMGWALPILLFDRVVVPDLDYVAMALDELEEGTLDERQLPEVALGLGYYLCPNHEEGSPEAAREAVLQAEKVDKITCVSPSRHTYSSTNALHEMLEGERLRAAIQEANGDYANVFTFNEQLMNVDLTAVPPQEMSRDLAIRFLIKTFPFPSKDVPLDEVLSFSRDSQVQADLLRLRSWMNGALEKGQSPSTFEDEFMSSFVDYKRAVELLQKQHRTTSLGIIGSTVLDVVDSLVNLKLGSAFRAVMSWRTARLDLEKELAGLPDRHLEYVRKLESSFREPEKR